MVHPPLDLNFIYPGIKSEKSYGKIIRDYRIKWLNFKFKMIQFYLPKLASCRPPSDLALFVFI